MNTCLHCGANAPNNRRTCNAQCLAAYRATLARRTIAVATPHPCLHCQTMILGRRTTCNNQCLKAFRKKRALWTIIRGPRCVSCKKRLKTDEKRNTCSDKCFERFRSNKFAKNLYGMGRFLANTFKLARDKRLAARLQEQRNPVGSFLAAAGP